MNRLKGLIKQIGKEKMPPVHLWKPEHIGEIDIRIDAQGFGLTKGMLLLEKSWSNCLPVFCGMKMASTT